MALETLMTADQLSDYLKLSKTLLARWRSQGIGPKFIKVGGSVRYRQSDIEEYVNSLDNPSDLSEV
ncbi:excisionase and transcriptional regulator [Gordonia phage GMA2]|uniref:Helix-turn-helix domain-containing protein n=1 Tax=Gordonia phage GMA2 TaxID=1647283 RepID=A0A0K0N7A4_9CAUD|nr:excisionase and transcriptional regulator [Gordonia phage GMA2]AKJ72633.1 hypothetical protein GMA2_95 [Gordonia phage GMA2]